MNSLLNYLDNEQYKSRVLENYCQIIGKEIINESFQSSLLISLAKKISKAEAQNKSEEKENYKKYGYSSTHAKSFTSIFGPVVKTNKWGAVMDVTKGLKWSEIKDDDFEKYTDVHDKKFVKLLKSVYAHKTKANIICCESGTQNPIYFIKGYTSGPKDPIITFQFEPTQAWYKRDGVYEKTAPKGKYGERELNCNEVLKLFEGYDIYVLVITDSMQTEYMSMFNDRKESKKGVINYDEQSLDKLLKEQQARYKTLVEKIKATNLKANSEKFLNEIKQVNDEVVDLYKKITSNPKYLDMNFPLGDLIRYVSYAYEEYYRSAKYGNDAEKEAKKYPGLDLYSRESSNNAILDAKNYLTKIKKSIEEIKSQL